MNSPLSRAAAVLLLAVLSGCAGWIGGKDNSPKPVDVPRFTPSAQLERVASFSVDEAESYVFQPVWFENRAWAVGADGRVQAGPGGDAPRLDFGSRLGAGLDVAGDLLVAASDEGVVLALGRDGTPRWRQDLKTEILSRPRLAGGLVLVRAQDGRLIALSEADGSIKWQSESKNPSLALHAPSGVSVAANAAYVALPGGRLRAHDLSTGNLLWETWVAQPRGATELERVTDVVGDPWVSGEQVCAVTFQGRIGCFGRSDGIAQWTRDFSSVTGLDGDHRYVYAADADSVVHAFDKATGRQVWKQDKLFARRLTRPTVVGRYLAVADYEGKLFLLDSETGDLAAETDVGDAVRAPVTAADEQLLVQDADGQVSLFKLR